MKGSKAILLIIIVLIAVFAIALVSGYNSLVSLQIKVEEQQANIDTQLQRRIDLIPNLVNTVQSFANHETEVFNAVTQAREKLMAAGSMEEKASADEMLNSALGRLIAVAENYPELKSDTVYIGLMDELAGTENRIAYSRQSYNEAVTAYNKAIRVFPTALIARLFGFEKASFFEAAQGAETVPEVNLH